MVETKTPGVGTRAVSEFRLLGTSWLDPEMLSSTSVNRPVVTATVEMADETGQPPLKKKRRLNNGSALSKDGYVVTVML